MKYTYVLKMNNGQFYTGSTNDLRKRFKQYIDGRATYTKDRRPVKLIYHEACLDEADARAREKYLKSGSGKRYINNRLKRFLILTG